MAERIAVATTLRVPLRAALTSDHVSPATGKTITITISKNGSAYANPSAGATTATEVGSGYYYVDLSATDTGTLGPLGIIGTASATDNVYAFYDVVQASAVAVAPVAAASTPTGTSFLTSIDIANRALQHCGATMLDPILGFTEVSKNAQQTAFCYPKLRRAELRRNVWRFAIRRAVLRPIDATTMLLYASLWTSTTTYFIGSIVADENGTLWQSNIRDNLNYQPENSSTWTQYFGPMSVSAYDSGTAYFAGEIVYTAAGDGTNKVYVSLIDQNSDVPATATAWAATTTYFKNQIITRSSVAYMSLIDFNLNQDPVTTFHAAWASGTTYSAAAKVTGSDGTVYSSVAGSNVGHDPVSTIGFWTNTGVLSPWTTSFVSGTGSLNWRQIGGAEFPMGVTIAPLNIIYPLGSGPTSQSTTRNAFRLPAGFLRKAPTDPKAGSTSYLGAAWGLAYQDWNFEGAFITSAQTDPIMLRFVADTVDVSSFDDMFCEGLAARIGIEVCESLTQSDAKVHTIAGFYDRMMGEARTVNGIETGAEEPAIDDWIACRA